MYTVARFSLPCMTSSASLYDARACLAVRTRVKSAAAPGCAGWSARLGLLLLASSLAGLARVQLVSMISDPGISTSTPRDMAYLRVKIPSTNSTLQSLGASSPGMTSQRLAAAGWGYDWLLCVVLWKERRTSTLAPTSAPVPSLSPSSSTARLRASTPLRWEARGGLRGDVQRGSV